MDGSDRDVQSVLGCRSGQNAAIDQVASQAQRIFCEIEQGNGVKLRQPALGSVSVAGARFLGDESGDKQVPLHYSF